MDTARRLLLTSTNLPGWNEYQLVSNTATLENGALIKHEVGDTLPWRDRLREWVRWTAPTSKEANEVRGSVGAETVLLSKSVSHQGQGKKKTTSGVASTYWSSKYFTETSAIMGKVLHSNVDSSQSSPTPLAFGGNNQLHTFFTQVPNLSRVLSKAQVDRSGERMDFLVLRFLPNPFFKTTGPLEGKNVNKVPVKRRPVGSQAFSAFPAIEMRFAIDRKTKDPVLQEVQAVVQESRTDVMLPYNNIDVRFQQRTTSRLDQNSIESVREYIQQSDLKMSGSKLLQTPPSIRIPIDSHLCRGPGLSLLGEVESKGDKIPKSNVGEVEYLFAGLEIRSTLSFEYRSWLLRYTSIEAGKAGGRRSELALRPSRDRKPAVEQDFIKMAYELASEFGDQGNESLVSEPSRPRRVDSGSDSDSTPDITRKVLTDGPVGSSRFKYFARRIALDSEMLDDLGECEVIDPDVDHVAPVAEASNELVAAPNENMDEGEMDVQDDERASKVMEEDLKNIEADRI